MTIRKQTIGLDLASGGGRQKLANIVEPKEIFIGDSDAAKTLYRLENKRNAAITACATEWGKVMDVDLERMLWSQLMPQALFDTLESYSPAAAIIAAEAFLKQFGWKVERPEPATAPIEITTSSLP